MDREQKPNAAPRITPENRFTNRVENYVKYRPGYPPEVIRLLEREAGLGPGAVVADIGAGTGIFTRQLLETGATVRAVEPNAGMLAAAVEQLSGFSGFHAEPGTAQATGLPDGEVDLITAAQAFHWFNTAETRAEFSRILKPGGRIALIWNERRTDSTPFLRDYEELLKRYATDYVLVRHGLVDGAQLRRFFRSSPATAAFCLEQQFDLEGLRGRLLSSSCTPAEGQPGHEEMLATLKEVFARHADGNGQVVIGYDTRVWVGD